MINVGFLCRLMLIRVRLLCFMVWCIVCSSVIVFFFLKLFSVELGKNSSCCVGLCLGMGMVMGWVKLV